jgi:O-methyltransferase
MSPMRQAARAVRAVLPETARRKLEMLHALSGVRGPLSARTLRRIVRAVAPYTMVVPAGVAFAAQCAAEAARSGRGGAIVECGVWRGGTSFAMLLAQREAVGRVVCPVHMLDSFQGLPPAGGRDGPLAHAWQAGESPDDPDANCRAEEAAVRTARDAFGFTEAEAPIHRGWFRDTVGPLADRLRDAGGIALLRLDGDWYDSTVECLEALLPVVQEGATVIIDDYYAWDGCARAVHDTLSRHDLAYRIWTAPAAQGAWFVKRAARQSLDAF